MNLWKQVVSTRKLLITIPAVCSVLFVTIKLIGLGIEYWYYYIDKALVLGILGTPFECLLKQLRNQSWILYRFTTSTLTGFHMLMFALCGYPFFGSLYIALLFMVILAPPLILNIGSFRQDVEVPLFALIRDMILITVTMFTSGVLYNYGMKFGGISVAVAIVFNYLLMVVLVRQLIDLLTSQSPQTLIVQHVLRALLYPILVSLSIKIVSSSIATIGLSEHNWRFLVSAIIPYLVLSITSMIIYKYRVVT